MATPSTKSPEIEAFLSKMFGKPRAQTIRENKCTMCETPNMEFLDERSAKEYTISGGCQSCQDRMFG